MWPATKLFVERLVRQMCLILNCACSLDVKVMSRFMLLDVEALNLPYDLFLAAIFVCCAFRGNVMIMCLVLS